MTNLTLITGFLGSGKTTLLQQLLSCDPNRRYIVLVNEFSSVDIDGQRVEQTAKQQAKGDHITPIPGGSIFCQCLVTTFIDQLKHAANLAEEAASQGDPFDGILIEASGMADPSVTPKLLEDTKLDQRLKLQHIVAMVDPSTFIKLRQTLPNIQKQIQAATLLVINKTDCFSGEVVDDIAEQLREINPIAAIVKTSHGRGVGEMLDEAGVLPGDVQGELAGCRDPNYDVMNVEASQLKTLGELAAKLREHASEIYRAKGTLTDRDGQTHVIDLAGNAFENVSLEPSDVQLTAGQLVLIVAGGAAIFETDKPLLRVL